MEYELIKFKNDILELDINVSPKEETVWLNQAQMATLFETTQQNISNHIKNILIDKELSDSVHKKILYTAQDGKTYNTSFYNLDMILAVGYRVKSKRAIEFRIWVTNVLKEYLLKGYVINADRTLVTNENYLSLISDVNSLNKRLTKLEDNQKNLLIKDLIIFNNQMFEALVFLNQVMETAKQSIILIDPYVDIRTLNGLKKHNKHVELLIITSPKIRLTTIDINAYTKEYGELLLRVDDRYHDRFLIIDDNLFYNLGSSVNYLGKRITEITLETRNSRKEFLRKMINQVELAWSYAKESNPDVEGTHYFDDSYETATEDIKNNLIQSAFSTFDVLLHLIIIPQVILLICEKEKALHNNALLAFYQSQTYDLLSKEDSKLWHLSPLAIYTIWKEEQETGELVLPKGQ